MNKADRKVAKASIRAALRAKALGLPLSPYAEAVMLWIDWLRASQEDDAAKRVLSSHTMNASASGQPKIGSIKASTRCGGSFPGAIYRGERNAPHSAISSRRFSSASPATEI
jgi:hypothetical protein